MVVREQPKFTTSEGFRIDPSFNGNFLMGDHICQHCCESRELLAAQPHLAKRNVAQTVCDWVNLRVVGL